MIFEDMTELRSRIADLTNRKIKSEPRIHEDTSDYMTIVGGSVLRLGGNDYYVITDAREGRFGIDDQPKYWVKYVFDLTTGDKKVIKLVFYEKFTVNVGMLKIRCNRSPKKESTILDLVRDCPRFMQGTTVNDPVGNLVRIIDVIPGSSLYKHIVNLETPHEVYFSEMLPDIMRQIIGCIESLVQMHSQGQHHGDIRSDHILIDTRNNLFTWIDFDYQVDYTDYDLWSIGNLLIRLVGKGIHSKRDLHTRPSDYPFFNGGLSQDDLTLLLKDRIANLRKLFPYIPIELNEILMRFSRGSADFYPDLNTLISDLKKVF